MTKCSIVLLSWTRPENIENIITKYQNYDSIDEIIVWNNNENYLLHNCLSKVKTINSNQDLGLNTRFATALLCKNRCVILHDDDLILSEKNIAGLIENFEKDCSRIYTYEGRNLIDGTYNYSGMSRVENVNQPTEVDIALTRSTCFDKLLASEYFKLSDVIFYDASICLNGEDILISYLSRNVSGKKPLVIPLADNGYEELPIEDKISTRNNFLEDRNKIVQRCEIILPGPRYDRDKNVIFGSDYYPFAYLENSACYNTIYSKILSKQSNGIKYLSIEADTESEFAIASIFLKDAIKISKNININAFFKNKKCSIEVHFYCDIGCEVVKKIISLSSVDLNYTSQFEFCLDDLNLEKEFLLTEIDFIIGNRMQSCELCITNLSYDQ